MKYRWMFKKWIWAKVHL